MKILLACVLLLCTKEGTFSSLVDDNGGNNEELADPVVPNLVVPFEGISNIDEMNNNEGGSLGGINIDELINGENPRR